MYTECDDVIISSASCGRFPNTGYLIMYSIITEHFSSVYLCTLNVMMSSFQGCPLVTVVKSQTLATW